MGRSTVGTNRQNGFSTLADFAVSAAALGNVNSSRRNDKAVAQLNEEKMVGETRKNNFISNMMAGGTDNVSPDTLAQQYRLYGLSAPELSSVQGNVGVAPYRPIEAQRFAPTSVGQSMINKNDAAAANSYASEKTSQNGTPEEQTLAGLVKRLVGDNPPTFEEFTAAGGKADRFNNSQGRMGNTRFDKVQAQYQAEPLLKFNKGMDSAWGRMKSSAEGAMKPGADGKVNANALLTMFAKLLDPESVVRGPEVDTLTRGLGIRGWLDDWTSMIGEDGRLSPENVKAFMRSAQGLMKAAKNDAIRVQETYRERAIRAKRPGEIVYDPIAPYEDTGKWGAAAQSNTPERPQGMSDEQRFEQLRQSGLGETEAYQIMMDE